MQFLDSGMDWNAKKELASLTPRDFLKFLGGVFCFFWSIGQRAIKAILKGLMWILIPVFHCVVGCSAGLAIRYLAFCVH